jgi:predicted GTPase
MRKLMHIASPAFAAAGASGSGAAANAAERVAPQFAAVSTAVPLPEKKTNRGSVSIYPFADLSAVGMSIPVLNKTAKQLASIVSNANRKAKVKKTDPATGALIFKTKTVPDGQGGNVTVATTEPEMVQGAHYIVADCDPKTDPDKATARIFRDK